MMKKDEILEKIYVVIHGVLTVNSFVVAYESILEASRKTPDEYKMSSSFFAVARHSLQQSIFIDTAKLLEDNKDALSVRSFFELYQEYLCRAKKKVGKGVAMSEFFISRFYDDCNEYNIQQIVKMESELCNWRHAFNNCTNENDGDCEHNNLCRCIYCLRKNLRTQRDKFYAHCDKKYASNPKVLFEEYPISHGDVKKLIEYAHTVLNTIKGNFTSIDTDPFPYQSNDLGNIFYKLHSIKYDVCGNDISDKIKELQTKCHTQQATDLSARRE